jgi:hypothetical protein
VIVNNVDDHREATLMASRHEFAKLIWFAIRGEEGKLRRAVIAPSAGARERGALPIALQSPRAFDSCSGFIQ